ncbi:MAG: PAS domain S-box protein [Chloroflexi bacterium]|uniref:histidine kinase n=1 Tax=Candidatus Chlorohelix allophototropha TaxID=3003348 RepID=A0A8T7MAY1_9CHLR|nr:PAS domain S-box protein [Chloroflexota bacterium]WJW68990.1 PAS domain S-box protein [Chloroflexota bacterium L227-S17]
MQFTFFTIPLYLSAIILLGLGFYGFRFRGIKGSFAFFFDMLICAAWALNQALALPSDNLTFRIYMLNIVISVLTFLGITWLVIVLSMIGKEGWLNRKKLTLLFIPTLFNLTMLWTNDYHHLFLSNYQLNSQNGFIALYCSVGPMYWVYYTWNFTLIAVSLVLLLEFGFSKGGIYLRQALLVGSGSLVPLAADLAYALFEFPLPGYELAPVLFVFTGLCVAWALFRHHLLEFTPIRLSTVVENMSDLLLVLDAQDRIVEINGPAGKFFGIDPRSSAGKATAEALNRWPQLREAFKTSGPGNREIYLDSVGMEKIFDLSVTEINTGLRGSVGRAALLRDITLRKQAESARVESDRRYRLLAENSLDIISRSNLADVFIYVSPACQALLGYEPEEMLGHSSYEYFHPNDLDPITKSHNTILEQTGKYTVDHRMRHKDGRYIWFESTSHTIRDEETGRILEIQSSSREITARRQAEEALKESEARYRFLAENSTDTISLLSPERVFEYASPACQKIIGFASEELVDHAFLEFVHPDDQAQFLQLRANWKEQNKEVLITYRHRCKNEQYLWVEVSAHYVTDPATGQLLNIIAVARDITERRKMEEALNAEKLKAKNLESLGVLAGGIAHNFNNALTGVTGYISLAKVELEETSDAYDYLTEAEKATQHVAELAQRLVPFANGGAPIKQKVKLENIIKTTTSFMNQNSRWKYIFDLPSALWSVLADPTQIRDALQNLIKNALEAMPEGGIIEVKAANVTLEANQIPLLNPGRYVQVTVQDQGCGIKAEELIRIFDPYYTTKFMGNGLGLALSYSIIKRHGGQIVVESEWGRGTTLHFYLPVIPEEAGV